MEEDVWEISEATAIMSYWCPAPRKHEIPEYENRFYNVTEKKFCRSEVAETGITPALKVGYFFALRLTH